MAKYIVNMNADENGRHEVHNEGNCDHLPKPENRKFVGYYDSCGPAKAEAKKTYPTADGCGHCCPACHTD